MPLLRSPPFPWVAPAIAAIGTTAPASAPAMSAGVEALAAAMAAARVGGSFWAAPVPNAAPNAIVLRPADPLHLQAMLIEARAGDRPIITCLPDAPWAASVAAELAHEGHSSTVGPVDPWSLLARDALLLAADGDEWLPIAAAAGCHVAGRSQADLLEVLGRALASRYRDPFADRPIGPAEAIAILGGWRRTIDLNRTIAAAAGMAWWKRTAIDRLLWADRPQPLLFGENAAALVDTARRDRRGIAVWPSRMPDGLPDAAAMAKVPLIEVEDGFVRSVGLGADLHPPLSIVVDGRGIYYDPTRPSDLETLLEHAPMPPDLLARAERIARLIVERGISKYARDAPPAAPSPPRSRRTVLVAGQVEDDRSVALGGAGVAGNLDLLARARRAEPDAVILFKPHPDVDAGHRRGRVADADLLAHADAIVRGEPMPSLLARVDAVHVLTSLTGFEALLRGLEVVTHGHPFFAGWGLTRDFAGPLPRRTRRLTLPQLVAGTLILYPRYLDPVTTLPCPPEVLLARLAAGWVPKASWLVRARRLQGRLAKLIGTTTD